MNGMDFICYLLVFCFVAGTAYAAYMTGKELCADCAKCMKLVRRILRKRIASCHLRVCEWLGRLHSYGAASQKC